MSHDLGVAPFVERTIQGCHSETFLRANLRSFKIVTHVNEVVRTAELLLAVLVLFEHAYGFRKVEGT